MKCPFCKCDPFHYVDNGVGWEPVAINCCELGIDLYHGSKERGVSCATCRIHLREPRPGQCGYCAKRGCGLRRK